MAESKHKIRNSVIIAVISGLILYFGTTYHKEIFRGVFTAAKWFWSLINYRVALPIWALVLLALFAILAVLEIIANFIHTDNGPSPDYLKYTEDRFFGAVWRWKWDSGNLTNLHPYCPRCDTFLVCREYSISDNYDLFCETCGYKTEQEHGDLYHIENKVKRQIDRELRHREKRKEDTN